MPSSVFAEQGYTQFIAKIEPRSKRYKKTAGASSRRYQRSVALWFRRSAIPPLMDAAWRHDRVRRRYNQGIVFEIGKTANGYCRAGLTE